MKKAWVENSIIRDCVAGDPSELFHPDIVQYYVTDVPDEAQNGWRLVDGVWQAPPAVVVPAEPTVPEAPKVSPVEFKLLFTPQERVAIKTMRASDPLVADFYEIVEDPRLTHVDLGLASVQGALAYLTQLTLLAPGRMEEILTGVLQ